MSNLHFQLHLIHGCNTDNFDVDIWLEVSRVLLVRNECLHFVPEKLDILEGSSKINVNRELFPHGIRSRNILDPHRVKHNVWYLSQLVGVNMLEDCIQQGDVFDD